MSVKVLKFQPPRRKLWTKASHNLVRNELSGVYYVRKYKAGKGRLFKTTGETRKGLAQTIADVTVAEWMGGKRFGGRRYRVREVCELLYACLDHEAPVEGRERRAKTRRRDYEMYRPAAGGVEEGTISRLFGDLFVDEIDEFFWKDWTSNEGKRLGRTLGDIAKCLSKVMTFAFERKIINRKPHLKNPDPKKQSVQHYTPDQVRLFWKFANQDAKDLIIIGAECGLRPHENSGLRREWIRILPEKRVEVRIPDDFEKRWKGRNIILSPAASQVVLRRLKANRGPCLFPSPKDPTKPLSEAQRSRYWRRALHAANKELFKLGLPQMPVGRKGGFKFHWLRHTWFTQALMVAGADLKQASAYGGNSPKVAFETYTGKGAELTADIATAVSLGIDQKK